VTAQGTVAGVQIPPAQNTTLVYPLARFGEQPATVAFAAYLAGPEGLAALTDAGFLPP
jgi:molybdate transport system substrate-binding protein